MRRASKSATELGAFALGLALCACSDPLPEGHIVFHVDTDATLPSKPGPLDPMHTPALFDRMRIDFFSPGSDDVCTTCSHDFNVDQDVFSRGAWVTVRGNVDRARVRLYRSVDEAAGVIFPLTTIEVVVRVPHPPSEGAIHTIVDLDTDRVGFPSGTLKDPDLAVVGTPGASRVGTWQPGLRTPCKGAPRPGEVCIPGGAFFMGNALADPSTDFYAITPRLVVLSPFFLDAREATQGAVAEWITRTKKDPTHLVVAWTPPDPNNPSAPNTYCTYGRSDPNLPVNCISKDAAREYCRSQGKMLPTDAQFEYAAGGLMSNPYVWGTDPPACGDLVWGLFPFNDSSFVQCNSPTPVTGPIAWSTAPNVRNRDVLALPTGKVYDLMGNLSEYVLDAGNLESDACWASPGTRVVNNPTCTLPSADPNVAMYTMFRGGSWEDSQPANLRASYRQATDPRLMPESPSTYIGFRCARPSLP